MQAEPTSIETSVNSQIVRCVVYFHGTEGSGKATAAEDWLKQRGAARGGQSEINYVSFEDGQIYGYSGSDYVLIKDWDPSALSSDYWALLLGQEECNLTWAGVNMKWDARFIAITGLYDELDFGRYSMYAFESLDVVKCFKECYAVTSTKAPDGTQFQYCDPCDLEESVHYLRGLAAAEERDVEEGYRRLEYEFYDA